MKITIETNSSDEHHRVIRERKGDNLDIWDVETMLKEALLAFGYQLDTVNSIFGGDEK